jgi:hypothetical protein
LLIKFGVIHAPILLNPAFFPTLKPEGPFASCATNPYSQFYHDFTGGVGVAQNPMLILPSSDPKVIQGQDIQIDFKKMEEDGYMPIGESSFNGADATPAQALSHARTINAEIVLIYQQYTDTTSGVMPLTLPDSKSSTTYFYGNAYGSGGSANLYGSSYQTTYGTKTTYIPYNVRRYDFYASYWVKAKPPVFGIRVRDLTDEEKRGIGSNKGVAVAVVQRNSPAYNADIIAGDIIKTIQGESVLDTKEGVDLIVKYKGQEIRVEIARGSQSLTKTVKLNE